MRESIKVIKWCGSISLLFLVLKYLVSVNIEGNFIELNTVWMSNSFLLTLFGGVFASMLVVVLCEVQKYLSEKANTELFIFFQGLYLYQALEQMRVISTDYINHQELQVTENLFDESIRMIQSEMNALQNTDYATFKQKKDSLMYEHGKFRADTLQKLQPILQSGTKLRIAINEEKRDELQKQLETHQYGCVQTMVTSSRNKVRQVLNAEAERLSEGVDLINQYLETVDRCCGYRFKWSEIKGQLRFPHVDEWMSTTMR